MMLIGNVFIFLCGCLWLQHVLHTQPREDARIRALPVRAGGDPQALPRRGAAAGRLGARAPSCAASAAASVAGMPEAADLLITGTRVRTMDPGAPIAVRARRARRAHRRGGRRCRDPRPPGPPNPGHRRSRAGRRPGPGRRTLPPAVGGAGGAGRRPERGVRPRRRARAPRRRRTARSRRRRGSSDMACGASGLRPARDGVVLDAAVGGRPAFVSFADGHGALANPAALERARRRRPAHVRRCIRDRLRRAGDPDRGAARTERHGGRAGAHPAARGRTAPGALPRPARAHGRPRPRGRARHGRHSRRPRRPGRARGRRRSAGASDRPHLAAARHGRRPDRRRDRPRRPVGPPLALRRGQVLPRRGRRPGHGVARGTGPGRPRDRAELARAGALRRGGRRAAWPPVWAAPPTRSAIGPSASRSTPTRPRGRVIRGARPAGSNTSSCAIRAISAGSPPRA